MTSRRGADQAAIAPAREADHAAAANTSSKEPGAAARTPAEWCDFLRQGALQIIGLLPGASNYTMLARTDPGGVLVVYKPRRGENPLWDFPRGSLCRREVAAYLVSEAGGWHFVPPTVLRDGPMGVGAVQLFIDHDPAVTAFDLSESHADLLMHFVAFDAAINNADRKAGHVLLATDGSLWGVDHGVCFNAEPKLRTVLWEFEGEAMPAGVTEHLETLGAALGDGLKKDLSDLLSPQEIDTLARRTERLLVQRKFPRPGPERSFPWPMV